MAEYGFWPDIHIDSWLQSYVQYVITLGTREQKDNTCRKDDIPQRKHRKTGSEAHTDNEVTIASTMSLYDCIILLR